MNNLKEEHDTLLKPQKSLLIMFEVITYLFINLKLLFLFYIIVKMFLYIIKNILKNLYENDTLPDSRIIKDKIIPQIVFYIISLILVLFFSANQVPIIIIFIMIVNIILVNYIKSFQDLTFEENNKNITNKNTVDQDTAIKEKSMSSTSSYSIKSFLKYIFLYTLIFFIAIISFIINTLFLMLLFFMNNYSFDLDSIEEKDDQNEDINDLKKENKS